MADRYQLSAIPKNQMEEMVRRWRTLKRSLQPFLATPPLPLSLHAISLSTHGENYRLNTITMVTSIIRLVNLRRILHIPPAPSLAAGGHTGALLQADVGGPLSSRPVSLGLLQRARSQGRCGSRETGVTAAVVAAAGIFCRVQIRRVRSVVHLVLMVEFVMTASTSHSSRGF